MSENSRERGASWFSPEEGATHQKREKDAEKWQKIWEDFTNEERIRLRNEVALAREYYPELDRSLFLGAPDERILGIATGRVLAFLEEKNGDVRALKDVGEKRHDEFFKNKIFAKIAHEVRNALKTHPDTMWRILTREMEHLACSPKEKKDIIRFFTESNFIPSNPRAHKELTLRINKILEGIEDQIPASREDTESGGLKQMLPYPRGRRIPAAPGADFANTRKGAGMDAYTFGTYYNTDDEFED